MTQQLKALNLEGRLLPPGEVIAGRFTVGERIGEGPFGQVFRAEDTLIEADVALKVFFSEVVKTPLDEEAFLKATRRARALTQKNVVRLHDSGVHKDHPWVSMQYLEGLNLQKVVGLRRQRDEGFNLAELEPIISQITLAVQHIGRDFPHGNLKPSNIVLLPELLKVTDSYVLASLPDDVFAERNADESFVAPELRAQGSEASVECDVYSVGAIIGYMLFGEDYQPGTQMGAQGALSAVDALCKRAMAFDPGERYPSVEALNEDFTSIVDTGALLDRGTGAAEAPPPPDAPGSEAADQPPPAPQGSSAAGSDTPPESAPSQRDSEVDPLEVETSPDIGKPPEGETPPSASQEAGDDVPSFDDLAATDAVGEKSPPESKHGETMAPKPPSDKGSGPPLPPEVPPQGPPQSKPESSPEPESSPAAGPAPSPQQAGQGEKGKKSGLIVAIIGGFAVIGGLVLISVMVIGGFVLVSGDDGEETEHEAEALEPEIAQLEEEAQQDPSPEELAEDAARLAEQERQREEERAREEEQARQQLEDALAAASAVPSEAYSRALDEAEEKAEELQEEQEQQEQAAATGAAAAPGGAAQPAQPAQATDCPSGMVRISVGGEYVCIDAYQHPGSGQMPTVNVSWFDARRHCDQQGKRLCALQEWRAACGSTYPYGSTFDPERCNTADADGFDRSLAATGSFSGCRSPSGAYDMSGNVHEWVEEQRVAGGGYDSGADVASCSYSSAMAPGSSRANVGFRCCAPPS